MSFKYYVRHLGLSPILLGILWLLTAGCTDDFLEKKPQKSLLVPSTRSDFQALLDNAGSVMNRAPGLNQFSDGDFTISDQGLATQTAPIRNAYLWAADIFGSEVAGDWDNGYKQVFYANVVLEGLERLTPAQSEQAQYNQLKGDALFYRAHAFYLLAQQFAAPYDSLLASSLLGIPLKLESDVTASYNRGTLDQTYAQIILDLQSSVSLCADQTGLVTRPSRRAALALLARVMLTMQRYRQAESYAAQCLDLDSQLLDYRTLPVSSSNPFVNPVVSRANPEVIFMATLYSSFTASTVYAADSAAYGLYEENDLRKIHFFKGQRNYKGTYTGAATCFGGLANDELYLIVSECMARRGDFKGALDKLSQLAVNRYKEGSFKGYSAGSISEALDIILAERRRQLIARGTRWTDLRRLNKEEDRAVTLKRISNGDRFELAPGSLRYVFPIPQDEITYSGISQNPR